MSQDDQSESDFVEMIESCLDSVWSLELLLLLHSQPERSWSTGQLVSELRSSELVVAQSVRSLVGAGLVVELEPGALRFSTASPDIAQFVQRLEREYRTRPNYVRRIIVGRANTKLQSFSDAFLLRRPSK